MPLTSSRLDLIIVPEDRTLIVSDSEALRLHNEGMSRAWWDDEGLAGIRSEQVVEGGFSRVRLERSDTMKLWANQGGGFRVTCPHCAAGMVRPLARLTESLRQGGPWTDVTCPSCGRASDPHALRIAPTARFARTGLWLADVGRATPTETFLAWVSEQFGPVVVVGRRVS